MERTLVVEIPAHMGQNAAEDVITKSRDLGEGGVLIKASQGTRWTRSDVDDVLDFAHGLGVFVGWLHYAEPHANAVDDEAFYVFDTLKARPLELGLWIEIGEHGTLGVMDLAEWVSGIAQCCSAPSRPVAFVVDPMAMGTMSTALSGRRVVASGRAEGYTIEPWAVRREKPITCSDGTVLDAYDLASTRALVPAVYPPVGGPEGLPGYHERPAAIRGALGGILPPPEPDEPVKVPGDDDSEEEVERREADEPEE